MTAPKSSQSNPSPFRSHSLDRKAAHAIANGRSSQASGGEQGKKLKRRASDVQSTTQRKARRQSMHVRGGQRPSIEMVPGTFRKVSGVQHQNAVGSGEAPVRLVELTMDGKPLGFHVERCFVTDAVDGVAHEIEAGEGRWQVIVSDLEEDCSAHAQGLLCNGDEIVSINGTRVDGLQSQQDVDLLMHVSECLRLAIKEEATKRPVRKIPAPIQTQQGEDGTPSSPRGSISSRRLSLSPASSPKFRPVRSRSQPSGLCCEVEGGDASEAPRPESGGGRPTETAETGVREDKSPAKTPENKAWTRTFNKFAETQDEEELFHPGTRMLELAQVFVPEQDRPGLPASERRTLLAECLAEEFDLPFLVEPVSQMAFSLRSVKSSLEE